MSHNYNGNPAGVTPATAIQVTIPDDGDADNVASVNPTAFQRLTDWVKFLFSFVGFMGGAAGGGSYNNVGPAGGTAFRATGGGGNSAGLSGTGTGTGPGVIGLAGAGSAGVGVLGVTDGTEAGVKGISSATASAGEFDSSAGTGSALKATAADANHLAMEIPEGLIQMNGATRAPNLAANNILTPGLLIKGWALVHTDGLGGVTRVDGQNIAAVALVAGSGSFWSGVDVIQVTWAQGFASNAYGVSHEWQASIPGPAVVGKTVLLSRLAADVQVGLYDINANAIKDAATTVSEILIIALGQQ